MHSTPKSGRAFVRGVVSGLRPTILVVALGALAGAASGYSLAPQSGVPLERLGNVFGHVVAYGKLEHQPERVVAVVVYGGRTADEIGVLRMVLTAHPIAQVAAASAALTGVPLVVCVVAAGLLVEQVTR
jgi:HAMP domain-containing protein